MQLVRTRQRRSELQGTTVFCLKSTKKILKSLRRKNTRKHTKRISSSMQKRSHMAHLDNPHPHQHTLKLKQTCFTHRDTPHLFTLTKANFPGSQVYNRLQIRTISHHTGQGISGRLYCASHPAVVQVRINSCMAF